MPIKFQPILVYPLKLINKIQLLLPCFYWWFFCFFLFIFNSACFAETSDQAELRLGVDSFVFPDQAQSDLQVSLKLWLEEIGKKTGFSVSSHVYDDVNRLQADFESKVINMVLTSTIRYIKYFDLQHLANGFKASKTTEVFDSLLLLTGKNTGIDQFSDLRDKRISLLYNDELAEIYLDTLTLKTSAKMHREFFNAVNKEKSSQLLILNLFFNNTDAVMVYKQAFQLAVELNPQINEKIKILQSIENIPWKVGFFHIDVDENLRHRALEKALIIGEYARGKQLLELFGFDRVTISGLADLNAERHIYNEQQSLIRKVIK